MFKGRHKRHFILKDGSFIPTQENICFEYSYGFSSSSKLALLADVVVAALSIFPLTVSVDKAAAMMMFAVYSKTNVSCCEVLLLRYFAPLKTTHIYDGGRRQL